MPVVSESELAVAYRKAKVDLYYSSDPRRSELATYEENLRGNLRALKTKINRRATTKWASSSIFVGSAYVAPKSLDLDGAAGRPGTMWSDPIAQWRESTVDTDSVASFRLMSRCSIDMHVLSTLWAMRVGAFLDKQLSSAASGSRLRRTRDGAPNQYSNGTFVPYLGPYKEWNKAGFTSMRESLLAKEDVIAITADASSYYHSLEPDFLLDSAFRSQTGLDDLSPEDDHLHALFVASLKGWQTHVGETVQARVEGLPVGLPAAAIVANMALIDFDRLIENEVRPVHYGRYVDDIILVLRDAGNLNTAREVWEWIEARSQGLLRVCDVDGTGSIDPFEVQYEVPYLGNSVPRFSNDKNRVYFLNGVTGLALVDALQRTTKERSSEWRQLPSFPDEPEFMTTDVVQALQADGDRAANLRTTDALTSSRAAFAITLRDVETLEADLDVKTWSGHRRAFFEAVHDHIMVPTQFFKLASYYPRIIKLAAATGDYETVVRLTKRLSHLCTLLEQGCTPRVTGANGTKVATVWRMWREHLAYDTRESLIAGAEAPTNEAMLEAIDLALEELDPTTSLHLSATSLAESHTRLAVHDLGHRSFRSYAVQLPQGNAHDVRSDGLLDLDDDTYRILPSKFWEGLEAQAQLLDVEPVPLAFAFPTRPVNLLELYALTDETESRMSYDQAREAVKLAIIAARGYSVDDSLPKLQHERRSDRTPASGDSSGSRNQGHAVLLVPSESHDGKRHIAVGMVETTNRSWTASVALPPDHSFHRYQRLTDVINQTMAIRGRVDYLVLPELSLPRHWFIRFALKLRARGTSLISGVEYGHTGPKEVRNQAWAALSIDGLGFPATYLVRHNKQRPAPAEERRLWDTAQKVLATAVPPPEPRIVDHGGFRFSLLVCSELTNIEYRSHLRGAIDALFVPEWNQDLHTFEALVESAALDIHAFIVQSNDRAYGDSRIRAPMREAHLRDLLRVRGGSHNYVVVAPIDFWSLRSFQSAHRDPDGAFKPKPDGFVIAPGRWRQP